MAVDAQTLLLQALLGGGGARQLALNELLSENGDADPTTQAILNYVIGQQASGDGDDEEEGDVGRELEQLRVRSETLATALGACHICFGDDESCPNCGGIGQPGWQIPERRLFAQLVGPAIERLRGDVD